MSYTFSIRATKPLLYREVLDGLGLPDVQAPDRNGTWPEGTTHLYRQGISTRRTEVTLQEGQFGVRILTLACPEDHDLALRLVERFSELSGSDIQPEEGERCALRYLRRRFDEGWTRGKIEFYLQFIRRMARDQRQTLVLNGPIRDFSIGPRLFAEIEKAGPEPEMAKRLLAAMRSVQYLDLSAYFSASVMEVSSPDGQKTITVSVWSPGPATHFSGSQYLALFRPGSPDELQLVPYEAVSDLAGNRATRLDENQCLIEPYSFSEWEAFCERARPLAVDPFRQRRKWWQFGR